MNICLYGASSTEIDKVYIETVEALGEKMVQGGHTLIYGGGANGMMGAAARGVFRAGGKIIGVVPSFFKVDGVLFENCDELIYTETMRERKQIMENKADGFIAVPGGIGTFDEMFEILTLKQLGRHNKPVVLLNINGYYDSLIKFLDEAVEGKFMTKYTKNMFKVFESIDGVIEYFENYTPDEYDFSVIKKVNMK